MSHETVMKNKFKDNQNNLQMLQKNNSCLMSFTKSDEFYYWRSAINLQISYIDFFWFATSHTYHETL